MADIVRGGSDNEIILKHDDLMRNYLQIQINEKLNQIHQLNVNLDRINSVDINKIVLAQKRLQKEIEEIQVHLKTIVPQDAEVINTQSEEKQNG